MTVHGRDRGQPVREAPRVRDLPAPRKNESAAGGAMQRVFAWPYRGILAFLIWTGVRPWQLTLLSLALNVVTGVLIVTGAWLAAAYYTVIAGSTVLLPILAYAAAGERVDHQLERVKQWMERQHAVLTAGFLAAVGLLLVYTGIRAV